MMINRKASGKETCYEDILLILRAHKERYRQMTEEDAVKLVFQGLLGVGHLLSSEERARARLHDEMEALEADESEPLTEKVGPDWFRLNLRAANASGISESEIASMLVQSAGKPLIYTRGDVYDFCMRLDASDRMRSAAERVLEEGWLPSHSEQYRAAYRPAYRVLHEDFRKKAEQTGHSPARHPKDEGESICP